MASQHRSARADWILCLLKQSGRQGTKPYCLYKEGAFLPLKTNSNKQQAIHSSWNPASTRVSWSPHCQSDFRWAFSFATCVGIKPHSLFSPCEEACSAETLVIVSRTPSSKAGTWGAWQKANTRFLWTSKVILFNLLKTGLQIKTAWINLLKDPYFPWMDTILKITPRKL